MSHEGVQRECDQNSHERVQRECDQNSAFMLHREESYQKKYFYMLLTFTSDAPIKLLI